MYHLLTGEIGDREGIHGNSPLYAQFFYKSKTILKNSLLISLNHGKCKEICHIIISISNTK